MTRDVSAFLDVDVVDPSTLEFQIAVAELPGTTVTESLSFQLNGHEVAPTVIHTGNGGRIHKFDCDRGSLKVAYTARVVGDADPIPVAERDLSVYLRPSRYSESDKFLGFAATEFGRYTSDADVVERVSSWVGRRLQYVPGSSDPIDGASDTLLSGSGVCRDYTHLVVALLRAMTVPARLVAVYAPGCDPMDFHAVAEAYVDGVWRVVDATRLAPRSSLVRIATGRDAADTAFLDNHDGFIMLQRMQVMATVDGLLPYDDITELVSMR